jgi:hypothetical protein
MYKNDTLQQKLNIQRLILPNTFIMITNNETISKFTIYLSDTLLRTEFNVGIARGDNNNFYTRILFTTLTENDDYIVTNV